MIECRDSLSQCSFLSHPSPNFFFSYPQCSWLLCTLELPLIGWCFALRQDRKRLSSKHARDATSPRGRKRGAERRKRTNQNRPRRRVAKRANQNQPRRTIEKRANQNRVRRTVARKANQNQAHRTIERRANQNQVRRKVAKRANQNPARQKVAKRTALVSRAKSRAIKESEGSYRRRGTVTRRKMQKKS